MSPDKCKVFRDHLMYIGLTFMLKDGKPPYMPKTEKVLCEAVLCVPKS